MAINSNSELGDKNPIRSLCSSKTSNLSTCRLIKINFAGKDSCSSSRAHGPNNNKDKKSPYFTNDRIQLLSRVTSKKVINKKPIEFISSFPLAASLYKSNSDELKVKKRSTNKVKKSVLTLPNEPVPMPKTYTVSDLNDSEYFNAINDSRSNKPKKRRSVKRNKKSHLKHQAVELCNNDARYCSHLNINLDCSSSEIVNFTGDGKRISKLSYKANNSLKTGSYPHDVWALLRNINKFKLRSRDSQNSVVPLRKRRPIIKKNVNSNDTHIIETCRTEEIAYISSFGVDSKTQQSCSPSSSIDRVTVIDKQNGQEEIIKQFSQKIFGPNLNIRDKIQSNINNQIRGRIKPRLKNENIKASYTKNKLDNYQVLASNTHHNNRTFQLEEENVSIEKGNNAFLPEVPSKSSSIFNPTENYSDKSSIKENDSFSNFQTINVRKGVRSGDTYKYNNMKSLTKSPANKVNLMKHLGDSEKQLNGITKIVLSKGKEILPKSSESQRKPRLALTLPNDNGPKLSRIEIKRRLANQKYPIVILGKDQLTNRGIYVTNVDPPQFDGLDKHIWPFMQEWSEEKDTRDIQDIKKNEIIKLKTSKGKNKINHRDDVIMNTKPLSNHNIVSRKVESKKKKNISQINNQVPLPTEVPSNVVLKPKPLFHLKNKVFHFLRKNPTPPTFSENHINNNRELATVLQDKKGGTKEATNIYNTLSHKRSLVNVDLDEVFDNIVDNKIVPKTYSPLRHPWSKGKWASDFIENIIKKIRSGVYYSVDRKENNIEISGTEVSTQTEINASKNACCQNNLDFDFVSNVPLKKEDLLQSIPGFDNNLTTLEIETIGTNKIAVKHCVTNVVVHFDIQVLGEAKNATHTKKSMSYIPVDVKDNQEKIFKCNTSIINSILPAELCTIIPTMVRNILDAENNNLFLQPVAVENIQPHSTALTQYIQPQSHQLFMNSILPGCLMSGKIKSLLYGQFRNNRPNYKNIRTNLINLTDYMAIAVTKFPIFNTHILNYYNQPSLILHIPINMSNILIETPDEGTLVRNNSYCMALQPYDPKKFSIVPFSGYFNINNFITQILQRFIVNEHKDFSCHTTNIIISRPLLLARDENENILSLPFSGNKVGVISLFNALKNRNQCSTAHVHPLNSIAANAEEEKEKSLIPSVERKPVQRKKKPNKVLRKKSYVKFYSKCNSMSSISSYKCTPLSRVINLEEFCQVLGSNLFCNVLDGCLEKKVLGAIEEMKNWITDISPKQALLILLLMNKKDTPNLIRFRPVLLQGIAVNRITKADELDTEIEVIERENFHKLPQYEGISYLSASPKNQDSLLEELYWIAKTTASDYQKTFDEGSEKLLKSLLEKRKKLNPSYLRVMARYVGLGLLAPTKL